MLLLGFNKETPCTAGPVRPRCRSCDLCVEHCVGLFRLMAILTPGVNRTGFVISIISSLLQPFAGLAVSKLCHRLGAAHPQLHCQLESPICYFVPCCVSAHRCGLHQLSRGVPGCATDAARQQAAARAFHCLPAPHGGVLDEQCAAVPASRPGGAHEPEC